MELVWKYGRLSSSPFLKSLIPFHSGIFHIVGIQVFPSTTKKNLNRHVHEPHFFNAYDSMRNEKKGFILAQKKKKDSLEGGVRKRAETEGKESWKKRNNRRMWSTKLPYPKRTQNKAKDGILRSLI